MKSFDYTSKRSSLSKVSYTPKSSILSTLAWGNKDLGKTAVTAVLADRFADHVDNNLEYYKDVIRYTFFNSIDSKAKKYPKVHFSDLPASVTAQVNEIQKQYLQYLTIDDIFSKLNIPKTASNKFSPLQGKYVYHYRKMYGTSDFCEEKHVSSDLLRTPLSDAERAEYVALN
jgi:hypothetical protein